MASVSKKSKTIQSRKWRDFCRRFIITAIYVSVWAGLAFAAIKVDEARGDVQGFDDSSASEIPVMEIFLKDVTLDEVHENGKDVKYKDNIVILDGVEYDGVEFKGRGNFSWTADKKSYRIKFGEKVSLLGMNKSKKWALVANSVDDSLMRNDLAQYLMGLLVDDYPFRGEFVELKIDGEELGVYYLIRTMEIGKEAVNLSDPMGVLVEFDNVYCKDDDEWYLTTNGNCLTLKAAVSDDNAEVAMANFVGDFNVLEESVNEGDFDTAGELIDAESFAKYYLISELTANPDAYITSWFLYKDGVDDKIHAGLAWDFDASFGNRKWGRNECGDDFYIPTVDTGQMNNGTLRKGAIKFSDIIYHLMEDVSFRTLVGEIYRERLMGKYNEITQYIDIRRHEIGEVAGRNVELWGGEDFETEIEYIKWWVGERMQYVETKQLGIYNDDY